MELKRGNDRMAVYRICRFNRTFMELKHDVTAQAFGQGKCFNRTFMELKHSINTSCNLGSFVLIGPSWN